MRNLITIASSFGIQASRKASIVTCIILAFIGMLLVGTSQIQSTIRHSPLPPNQAIARITSFAVHLPAIGEIGAQRSLMVNSRLRGDRGKLIFLAEEGSIVTSGEVIARMDPSPFEDRIVELESMVREQFAKVAALRQTVDWDLAQIKLELQVGALEVEAAQLELDKVVKGDGPQEKSRLAALLESATADHANLSKYAKELTDLAEKGYASPIELELAHAKVARASKEKEAAHQSYDNFIQHVYPMQVRRAEAQYERARIRREELERSSHYRVEASKAAVRQGEETLEAIRLRLYRAKEDLAATEVRAPGPGIVVHSESFFNGRRRKPLLGDILVQNQPIIELPDLSAMLVHSRIREMDLHKVSLGQSCRIRVDALPGTLFEGNVQQIGVLAVRDGNRGGEEKWFDLVVALDEPDAKLRPGMTARMQIIASDVKDAVCVPVHAVFHTKDGDVCYVISENGPKQREICVGTCNETMVAIQSGLQPCEVVSLVPINECQ